MELFKIVVFMNENVVMLRTAIMSYKKTTTTLALVVIAALMVSASGVIE
ncbi:MAG: hypothetical protein M3044_07490 [Thermoproteota archaeon]|nr:hypothetical protein [Thermoproteota archaeon]